MRVPRRLLLHTLAAGFGLAVIICGGLALRLASGPVSLGVVREHIEEGLAERFTPYRVGFDDVVLTWAGWQRVFDVLALNVVLENAQGHTVASVPEVSLGLSGAALLRGDFNPVSIELIRPSIALERSPEGDIVFELGGAPEEPSDEAPVEALLALLNAGATPAEGFESLKQVSVLNADLSIDDRFSGLTWKAHGVDINLFRTPTGIQGDLALTVPLPGITTEVAGTILYDRTQALLNTDLYLKDALPERLAAISPGLADLAGLDLPVSGRLNAFFDPRFALTTVEFELTGGPGTVAVPALWEEAQDIRFVQAKGAALDRFQTVRLDDLFVDFAGPSLSLSGLFHRSTPQSREQGSIEIKDVPIDDVGRYWPKDFAANARRWTAANLSDGMLRLLRADFDAQSSDFDAGQLPNDAIEGEIVLENVTVNYLDTVPKVQALDATGTFDARNVWFELSGGRLLEQIEATQGKLVLSDLGGSDGLKLDLELQGPASVFFNVLDAPRLGYPSRYGMSPEAVGGEVTADLHMAFPLLNALKLEQVAIEASAEFQGFAWPNAYESYSLANARLSLTLDNTGMDIQGPAEINGIPANLAWRENFGEGAPFLSRLAIDTVLDDKGFAAWRLPGPPLMSGRIGTELTYTDYDRTRRQIAAELDITQGVLTLEGLRWSKPTGEPGRVALVLSLDGQAPPVLEHLSVSAPDFAAEGHGAFDAGLTALSALELTTLRYGNNDFRLSWHPQAENPEGHEVAIAGKAFDLVPYIDDLAEEDEGPTPDLELTLDVERLITRSDGAAIRNATGELRYRGDSLRRAALGGTLEGGAPVKLTLEPSGQKTRRLRVVSPDAGTLLKTLDLFDNGIGGDLVLDAVIDDTAPNYPMTGAVTIEDYRVVEAPTLAQILSYGAFLGLLDLLQGPGIGFSKLEMPFLIENDIMTITEAHTSGPSLGINVNGMVNIDNGETDLEGTLVPAYAINSLLGNIPLVGDLLLGGEGEGIIAADFRVTGPIEDPDVSVNPASMLTPGFLRHVFDIFESEPAPPGKPAEPADTSPANEPPTPSE